MAFRKTIMKYALMTIVPFVILCMIFSASAVQHPELGLIQVVNSDPNAGGGTPGLPFELLIRTDVPSIYAFQGSPTTWLALSGPPAGGITGAGTLNTIAKFTGATAIGNSGMVDNGTTIVTSETLTPQRLNISPTNALGRIGWQAGQPSILNDWAPTGLTANTFQMVAASDNQGTLVTGISATGFNEGDFVWLCNFNAPLDAGVVGLSNQDSRSAAANRIITPATGVPGNNVYATYLLPIGCIPLRYTKVDPVNLPTLLQWVVLTPGAQSQRTIAASLGISLDYSNFVLTGTINDYNLPNIDTADGGPQGYSTTIAALSNGVSLPQATINVASTTGPPAFAGPGTGGLIPITVVTTNGTQGVLCTGTTATTFTGCIGGTGSMATGGAVNGGICEGAGDCLWDDYSGIRFATLTGAGATITGFRYTANAQQSGLGPVKFVVNYGSGNITLTHQDAGSLAVNRFNFSTGTSVVLANGDGIMLWHPVTGSNWAPLSGLPYTAGTGLAISSAHVASLNINGGVTQTCSAGQAVTSETSAGIVSCSAFLTGTTGTWVATSGSNVTGATNPTTTGLLTAQDFAIGPAFTASAITSGATTNNWNPTGCVLSGGNCLPLNSFVRALTSGTGTAIISGMVGPGAGNNPGFEARICNFGNGAIEIQNASASSAAGNRFILQGSLSFNPVWAIHFGECATMSYDNNGNYWVESQGIGQHIVNTAPITTLTSCGTGSPSVVGTDTSGTVTEGTTTAACTINFNTSYDTFDDIPSCVFTTHTAGNPVTITSVSRTAVTVANTSATGLIFDYICMGHRN